MAVQAWFASLSLLEQLFILASMLQKSKNGIERTCAVLLDASYEELCHGICHGLEQQS